MYSRSLYSFSSVKFFLANRAFIIPLLFFKIKYVFLLHYSISIVKTTQKKTAYRKNFLYTVSCCKADIRNPLRYLLMNAVASRSVSGSFQLPLTEASPLHSLVLRTLEAGECLSAFKFEYLLQ